MVPYHVSMNPTSGPTQSRRQFLRSSAACGAHLALLASAAPAQARRVFARAGRPPTAQEPWGRIEQVADGVWALVSTPLDDRTTLCNGGIIRGSAGVLVVEAFASPRGAAWLAGRARELTGRWPDMVVLTHFHGDHTGGIEGFTGTGQGPTILSTAVTRDLVRDRDSRRQQPPSPERARFLTAARILDGGGTTLLDLGSRQVSIVGREGHTRSDVTVELDEPSVIFCGDLVWNRMFPNYVDALPSRLSRDVRALVRERETVYVPGHGPLADAADIDRYRTLLDSVESAARAAAASGTTAVEAAKTYRVPSSVGEWTLFSARYYEVAIGAWLREL